MSSATFDVRVRQIRWEADDVVSVLLEDPEGRDLPAFEPGAHIDVWWREHRRQYSLCGPIGDRRSYRIAVRAHRDRAGVSMFVHEKLRVGDRIKVSGPNNRFSLRNADEYLFIAGGIGITPLLPMIEKVAAENRPWRLVYAARHPNAVAFRDELAGYGGRVSIHAGSLGGRLQVADVVAASHASAAIYCCGPDRLMSAVERLVERSRLFVERFDAAPLSGPVSNEAFNVYCRASDVRLTVRTDESMLEALEREGVQVDNDCRKGICGSCELKVISGDVDHRDSLLSDEERAAGKVMMPCVSRARSKELVLDV